MGPIFLRRRSQKRLYLLPLVAVFLAEARNRSRKLASSDKEDGVAGGISQYRRRLLGQRMHPAGRMLETTGSASDFKNPGTVGLHRGEIYAIESFRELDLQ